jgi:hypothetical protein
VNLDCLIFRLPQGDGLYLFLEELQGLRSSARDRIAAHDPIDNTASRRQESIGGTEAECGRCD